MKGEIGLRLQRRDHLNQSHEWRRVEEMQTNDTFGPGHPRAKAVTDKDEVFVAKTASDTMPSSD